MTGRGQTNALTRATAILATLFFLTSLILAVLASSNRQPRSILDGARPASGTTAPTAPTAPAPGAAAAAFSTNCAACRAMRRPRPPSRRLPPRADTDTGQGHMTGPVRRPFLFDEGHHAGPNRMWIMGAERAFGLAESAAHL